MGGSRFRRDVEGCETRSDSTSRRNDTITKFLAFFLLWATTLSECTIFVAETTLFLSHLFLHRGDAATFQRMMDTALRGLIGKYCLVYLDDTIIFWSTIQKHNQNLATVLQRLEDLGLKVQPDKCEFSKPELE